jgi:hypothetical protein
MSLVLDSSRTELWGAFFFGPFVDSREMLLEHEAQAVVDGKMKLLDDRRVRGRNADTDIGEFLQDPSFCSRECQHVVAFGPRYSGRIADICRVAGRA